MTLALLFTIFLFSTSSAIDHNIIRFGANPNGRTDSSGAFLKAWNAACSSAAKSTITVPAGQFLSKGITFRIRGSVVGPSDYWVIGKASSWFSFESVTGVTISGGTFDARGNGLWDCKNKGHGGCPGGATTLSFTSSKNIVISGWTSVNSQLGHIVLNGCRDVTVRGVKLTAAESSPNTDGIHVQLSTGITILNSHIATGDDCVSIGAGTTNLWIEKVTCGPGHGISIGSLGKDLKEPGVQNVTVTLTTFTGTENGVRIKTWGRPSNGFVRSVRFQHITVTNVQNPIVSGVRISDVTYQDIHGTSATEVAMRFDCSSKNPCSRISLQDIKLTYKNKPSLASCAHAVVSKHGYVEPARC
ncbi:Polygalacturonase-like protein [Drosera capensis]